MSRRVASMTIPPDIRGLMRLRSACRRVRPDITPAHGYVLHTARETLTRGRPPVFDPVLTSTATCSRGFFNRLEQFRDLATREAKRAVYYRAELTIAMSALWLHTGSKDTSLVITLPRLHFQIPIPSALVAALKGTPT